jgi:hypothetical protein
MKAIFISSLVLFLVQTVNAQSSKEAIARFEKIQWIIGQWSLTNAKIGNSGIEQWEKISPSVLQGKGINLKGKDTAFIERLRIVVKDDELFYVADVDENKAPVYFRILKLTDVEFICENQAHDFPKMIAYKNEGKKLTATISGNENL